MLFYQLPHYRVQHQNSYMSIKTNESLQYSKTDNWRARYCAVLHGSWQHRKSRMQHQQVAWCCLLSLDLQVRCSVQLRFYHLRWALRRAMGHNYSCASALQTLQMQSIYRPQSLCKLIFSLWSPILTTVHRSAGMYMQEALELVCRKRKLANLKDYALIVNDLNMLAYLDRTVASLGGRRELTLVKRSTLPQLGIEPESRSARTTDPNGTCE